MSEYIFLYRGVEAGQGSPEEFQARMQKWMTWIADLRAKGHVKDMGQPLERTGKLVSGSDKVVTDGPYAEKDLVSGFTLIEAADIHEAVELSKGCPIFDINGAVEVRPIMAMNR
jgi:hypothetical protein